MANNTVLLTRRRSPEWRSGTSSPPSYMFRPVRTRLLEDLARDAPLPKIVSIIAPVGYGKTVLMSELYAHLQWRGRQCFWVGLDDRAASVERVAHFLRLSISGPETIAHPTQTLMRGDETVDGVIEEAIETIARLREPVTLFIDNLNSCTDESLGTFLDTLIFRTSATVQFVWSGTTGLGINLGRAKLEGLIRHVGHAELSLNVAEARELLGTELDTRLGTSGVEAILHQTEGWPAAVRMAQIVLAEAEHPLIALQEFSGSDEDVAALLNRQVLSGFDPSLREFLLRLAQLRTFGADLCRHATGVADAERHIDFLLQRNVFIIPLDRNRKRYRLHALFREFLLTEAELALSSEIRCSVLRKAAEWCEQSSEWQDAVEYALASGDLNCLARILNRTATLFVRDRGDIPQFIQWIEHLLAAGVPIGWEAQFWYVWALVFHRRHAHGLQEHQKLVERLRRHKGRTDAPPEDLSQRLDHLRICIDFFTDQVADAYVGAERWLAASRPSDPYNTGSVGGMKCLSLGTLFRFAEARQTLRRAEPILLEVGSEYTMGWICLAYGIVSIYEGDYASAYRDLSSGLERARRSLGEEAVLCDTLAFMIAKCAVEMGLDREAEQLLVQGLRSAHAHGMVDTAACGFEALIKLWDGSSEGIYPLSGLREIGGSYPPRLSLMLSCFLVRRLLQLGRKTEAIAEAERVGILVTDKDVAVPSRDELSIPSCRDLVMATVIEMLLAIGKLREAESLMGDELRIAHADGRIARQVELLLGQAAVALHSGNGKTAEKLLIQCVSRAARRRIVRPFRDHAEIVAALVNDTRLSSWAFVASDEREFFAAICSELPVTHRLQQKTPQLCGMDVDGGAALTKREIELLSLINIGLSNKQMTDHTEISLGTIKWHLKNVYKKLGVTNRSAALARARALNYLSR